jgi:hypothetical protein
MGGQPGRFNFTFPGNRAQMLADGGRAKARERYGHPPGCSCPSCRKGKAAGGGVGDDDADDKAKGGEVEKAKGGGFRTASGNVSAAGRAKAEAKGETMPGGSFPIRNDADLKNAKQSVGRAKNPKAAKAFINKRARALGEPPIGRADGGVVERASGGKAGKGKVSVNIVIAPGGMHHPQASQPAGGLPPGGPPPHPPGMPVPMPPPGATPGAPAPMAMPVPMPAAGMPPGGGMPPPGMPPPPRAKGGRAPRADGGPTYGYRRDEKGEVIPPSGWGVHNYRTGEMVGRGKTRQGAQRSANSRDKVYGASSHVAVPLYDEGA